MLCRRRTYVSKYLTGKEFIRKFHEKIKQNKAKTVQDFNSNKQIKK